MKRMLTLGATALILGSTVSAMAQAPTFKPLGVSLRTGLFLPSEKATRTATGDGVFGFGIDYKLSDVTLLKPSKGYSGSLSLSLDYYGRNNVSNVPLLLNYVGRTGQVFYSAGAGIGFNQSPNNDKARFAYAFGLGYEFKSTSVPFFVEGKFFGNEKSELNGVGLFVGVRF